MSDEPYDHEHDDEQEGRRLGSRLDAFVPDVMKRAFYTGLGAVFLTEDGVRRQMSEMKLPKEVVSYVVNQSNKSKEELFDAIAREIAKVFAGTEPDELLRNAFTGIKVKMNIELEFAQAGEESEDEEVGVKKPSKVRFRTETSAKTRGHTATGADE